MAKCTGSELRPRSTPLHQPSKYSERIKKVLRVMVSSVVVFFGAQILLTGFVHRETAALQQLGLYQSKNHSSPGSGILQRQGLCSQARLLSMSDGQGNRYLALCQGGDCQKNSYKIKLKPMALTKIADLIKHSRRTVSKSFITTVLHLSQRPSGYMVGPGTSSRLILTPDHGTITGDLFTRRTVRLAGGKVLDVGHGEEWRECDAIRHLRSTLRQTLDELGQTQVRFNSSYQFLVKLEEEVGKAEQVSQSWRSL